MAHVNRLVAAFAITIIGSCVATTRSSRALSPQPVPGVRADRAHRTPPSGVSILVYHRFAPAVNDAMTVRTATFRWQLDYLKYHHHPIVPLRAVVSYLLGQSPAPPSGAVVITADDGHRSVFTEMLPIVREHNVPVTLFIYPSAISNASYAMTWEQLEVLHRTGLFDIESHTYWHPNLKAEKRKLSPNAYRASVQMQLVKANTVLQNRLGVPADLLAWPFGIHDDELIGMAREAGYRAAFTIERRLVTSHEPIMALPRFLVTDVASGRNFTLMLPQEGR